MNLVSASEELCVCVIIGKTIMCTKFIESLGDVKICVKENGLEYA